MRRELKIALILALIGGILTTAAFVMTFTSAEVRDFGLYNSPDRLDTSFIAPPGEQPNPPDGTINYARPWFAQKIFFFHVPIAITSFLALTVTAVFAILFMTKREKKYDIRSKVAMELTLVFVVGTMVSGTLWTLASWTGGNIASFVNQLVSEPRLLTYTVMMLLVIAYFVLRNSIEEDERRAMYSSVYAALSWFIAPISYFAADLLGRWMVPLHPEVFKSGMDPSNLIPFLTAMVGMIMLGYAIYALRVAEESSQDKLLAIKEAIEDDAA